VHKLCDVWCCAGGCNHPAMSRLCEGAVPNCDDQQGDVSQFEVVSESVAQCRAVRCGAVRCGGSSTAVVNCETVGL
jgi:hypothetical protein